MYSAVQSPPSIPCGCTHTINTHCTCTHTPHIQTHHTQTPHIHMPHTHATHAHTYHTCTHIPHMHTHTTHTHTHHTCTTDILPPTDLFLCGQLPHAAGVLSIVRVEGDGHCTRHTHLPTLCPPLEECKWFLPGMVHSACHCECHLGEGGRATIKNKRCNCTLKVATCVHRLAR